MPDLFLGELGTDVTPPVVSGVYPPDGTIGVDVGTTVYFDIADTGDGVDLDSIVVVIAGTIAFEDSIGKNGYVAVVTGTPASYHIVLTPPADFPGLTLIAGTIDAQDLALPPNPMTQYAWSFTTENADPDPPYITDADPPPGTIDVALSTDITFNLNDDISGVNRATIDVSVGGVPAIISGFFQPGFTGSITPPGASALTFAVVIDPDDPLPEGVLIAVDVAAEDMVGNPMDPYPWSFTTRTNAGPVFTDYWPTGTDVDTGTEISFRVTDVDGVEHIYARANGTLMINDSAPWAGFDVTFTPIVNGYDVLIQPQAPLLLDTDYEITAEASDPLGALGSVTWSFSTRVGLIVSPVLVAQGLDGRVNLSWSLPPPEEMLQTAFQLVRSRVAYPTTPGEGTLVYEGVLRAFADLDVINDTTYYYTVFVIRRYVAGVPEYVAYAPQASDDARPRAIVATSVRAPEYVPQRGEFGPKTVNPLAGGQTLAVWGAAYAGTLLTHDLVRVPANLTVRAPAHARVRELRPSGTVSGTQALWTLGLETDTGLVLTLTDFLPLSTLARGAIVNAGQILGHTVATTMTFAITKLPTAGWGLRTVRPAYFYATLEQRDGRR